MLKVIEIMIRVLWFFLFKGTFDPNLDIMNFLQSFGWGFEFSFSNF
jgi:hypothetical protein